MDPKERRTLPGWFRNIQPKVKGNYEAAVMTEMVAEIFSDRCESLVRTVAEMEVDGQRKWEALGARRVLEELGLGPHLEAEITQLRHKDGDNSDRDPWHEITEVTKTGAA